MEAFRVNAVSHVHFIVPKSVDPVSSAERTVLSALHLNASDTEVWKAAQTYLETISYIRILHLELRIAQFLSNIPSNAPQVVDSLINSDNVMSRSFKLKLPSVLLVKMETMSCKVEITPKIAKGICVFWVCTFTAVGIFYVLYTADEKPACEERQLLDQLNDMDAQFLGKFNRVFWKWEHWVPVSIYHQRGRAQNVGEVLVNMVADYKEEMKEFTGQKNPDEYRIQKAKRYLSFAMFSNASTEKIFDKTKTYLTSVASRRTIALEEFMARYIGTLNKDAPQIMDKILNNDTEVLKFANKHFWYELKLNNIPIIKRKCLSLKPNSNDVDTADLLENLKIGMILKTDDCFSSGDYMVSEVNSPTALLVAIVVSILFIVSLSVTCYVHGTEQTNSK
ncbi:hypothetical protein QR680_007948 [Steinernema hermaphroditum]|uniref:Uncharacterized protein n=1 Tax=Steinernema hermaphroditum TaxID=289476 RepID=A0AA39M777_9BILA|nr:hypothetical protein QR680_007948 [Steinernema hermaphroditum]